MPLKCHSIIIPYVLYLHWHIGGYLRDIVDVQQYKDDGLGHALVDELSPRTRLRRFEIFGWAVPFFETHAI